MGAKARECFEGNDRVGSPDWWGGGSRGICPGESVCSIWQMHKVWVSGVVFCAQPYRNKRCCHTLTMHLPLNFHLVVYNVYPTQRPFRRAVLLSEKGFHEIILSNTWIHGWNYSWLPHNPYPSVDCSRMGFYWTPRRGQTKAKQIKYYLKIQKIDQKTDTLCCCY